MAVSSINRFNNYSQNASQHNFFVAQGVDSEFSNSVAQTISELENFSSKSKAAVSRLGNVIILKDANSKIPEGFKKTDYKLHKYAEDAFGFVSKSDDAIVVIEDNHGRKNAELEGNIFYQGSDTITHEVGHLIDDEYSTSDKFKSAYLQDLKNLEAMLKMPNATICGENLQDMIVYLKHYVEGVNFEDGIDDSDITREGLRENFAECFSTIADSNPTKINQIFASLFPNTMAVTREFVI